MPEELSTNYCAKWKYSLKHWTTFPKRTQHSIKNHFSVSHLSLLLYPSVSRILNQVTVKIVCILRLTSERNGLCPRMCICLARSISTANHKDSSQLRKLTDILTYVLFTQIIIIFSNVGWSKNPTVRFRYYLQVAERVLRCCCQWQTRVLSWIQRLDEDFHATIICPLSHSQSPRSSIDLFPNISLISI